MEQKNNVTLSLKSDPNVPSSRQLRSRVRKNCSFTSTVSQCGHRPFCQRHFLTKLIICKCNVQRNDVKILKPSDCKKMIQAQNSHTSM
ncbi:hypothetical protein T4B_15321 [Trichinella pseudospiralis]|uniref:Uncharacterized protein n=1 Tax=Trichinella pseudospiralis TaxID=6337 RepID=A0A0V1E570_TRIPS|nr:hypothetical protein T4A_11254 [Trichinella pseudospiralis]KRZ24945.1 hypothetical protein T4B_15321 [Trichinella pseudospiralis]KRZ37809.1 hypothetical protein T4C_376 [Trichinella pseudospiralis]